VNDSDRRDVVLGGTLTLLERIIDLQPVLPATRARWQAEVASLREMFATCGAEVPA